MTTLYTRQDVTNRLYRASCSLLPLVSAGSFTLPDHLAQLLTDHTQGIEAVLLPSQLGLLMLRGASPLDCARHVADREHELPFQGCERQLFDALLTSIVERSQAPDDVFELVATMATVLDEYVSAIESHGSISRATLDDLFSGRLESEPGADDVR